MPEFATQIQTQNSCPDPGCECHAQPKVDTMENEKNQIVKVEEQQSVALVAPEVEKAADVMAKFRKLKTMVLTNNDIMLIQGRQFIKRSGWRQIALAFNVRTEILKSNVFEKDGVVIAEVLARASAPNGRYADELASCDSLEFGNRIQATRHNILTKATTRAVNRAISDLCGGGEVSAEEMVRGPETEERNEPLSQSDILEQQKKDGIFITPKQVNYAKGLADKAKIDIYKLASERYGLPLREEDGKPKCDLGRLYMQQGTELIDYLKAQGAK